ncbi:polyprenyl synthetase family protein [Bacillus spizizenii]|nr:polyprenyl synthetase family protein [Bacillus spizizenii]MCY8228562.1 polyprenyl synthetase family protein [Bacillus spizizenii]MCY8889954.1 polyprenyl synthetase family protein [Bacillus spizizenii]MEC0586303.1 polyprenyl synthetase family protein [Bacillus spizizenii]MEC0841047.1 polyprenyl synthetase family protein [Bacillus spizizenii]
MCLDEMSIKKKMKEIVHEKIQNSDLKEYLINFIDEKNHFSFGILSFKHYVALSGNRSSHILTLAGGIELLILAFDIFDDLEDEDNIEIKWMKIDPSLALNAATTLYTLGLETICSISNSAEFHRLTLKYALNAMQGQHEDLRNSPETEEECIQMMKQKAGSLTAMSAVLAAMLANGEFNQTIEDYAYKIGIIKQLENDYYGLVNDQRSDIRKKRKTLIYLFLNRKFNEASEKILKLINSHTSYHSFISDSSKFDELLFEAGLNQYVSMLIKLYEEEITASMNQLNINIKL